MTIQEELLAGLRALGKPSPVREIHKASGTVYTQRAFTSTAYMMWRAGELTRKDSPDGPLYGLPHNALERAKRARP